MNEERAARYHRLKRRAASLSAAWQALALLALLASGASVGLGRLAGVVASPLAPAASPHATVSLYVLVVLFVIEAGNLPIAFYSGFVLEKRYGLSVETPRQWLRQHLKGAAFGSVLALGASLFVYEALRRWPAWWWLASAGGYAAALVVLAGVFPVLILPMFYRLSPLRQAGLERRLSDLAERAGVGRTRFLRLELGARTRKVNAVFAGLGRSRRILLSDRLLDEYSPEEVTAVVAHEIGHHVGHDMWRGIAVQAATGVAAALAAHVSLTTLSTSAGVAHPSDVAGFPLIALATMVVSAAASPVSFAFSRAAERRADRFAIALSAEPLAYASAIRRLAVHNLSEPRPSRLVQVFYYTHPPVEERIAAAERAAEEASRGPYRA